MCFVCHESTRFYGLFYVKKEVLNRNHAFFFFVTWFHWYFWWFQWFHGYFSEDKIETLGGFMKPGKKINWNLWGTPLGPRAGAEALGPSGVPQRFQFFFCQVSWIPPKVFNFILRKYPWIPLKPSKISMNTRSQNKKNMRGFHWNPALVIFLPKMQL